MKSQCPVNKKKTESLGSIPGHLRGSRIPRSNKLRKRSLSPIIAAVGSLFFFTGCNQNLGSASSDFSEARATVSAITFSDVKEKIFVPHCLKCHATDTQKGDIDLERFETAFAVASMIREEVESDRMPRRAPPLTAELKALLFAWIDAGAPEK
ncbi:MAG: hypothetical protein J0L82_16780 [Deltaproteobacteria bacterium]|jgi:hypothetical protein|nr:hypothetical protein [Deltaproteobacteria bacterium]